MSVAQGVHRQLAHEEGVLGARVLKVAS